MFKKLGGTSKCNRYSSSSSTSSTINTDLDSKNDPIIDSKDNKDNKNEKSENRKLSTAENKTSDQKKQQTNQQSNQQSDQESHHSITSMNDMVAYIETMYTSKIMSIFLTDAKMTVSSIIDEMNAKKELEMKKNKLNQTQIKVNSSYHSHSYFISNFFIFI